MLSRPNFCCSCGEKVERIEWHVWTSRKYCEFCQTEHQLDDWVPRAAAAAALVIGLAGIGSLIAGDRGGADIVGEPVRMAKERARQMGDAAPSQPGLTRPAAEMPSAEQAEANDPQRGVVEPAERIARETPEPVSFCGALTKKGTPCTRKVKGGGRCWQHKVTEARPEGTPQSRKLDPEQESDETS